jgi:hypothetical protein
MWVAHESGPVAPRIPHRSTSDIAHPLAKVWYLGR